MYNPELIKHLDDWRKIPDYLNFLKKLRRDSEVVDTINLHMATEMFYFNEGMRVH